MPKSAYLIPLLLLVGCTPPQDRICEAALEGVSDTGYSKHAECRRTVWKAGFEAQHQAAMQYRMLPR